jgi:hypothetical protein
MASIFGRLKVLLIVSGVGNLSQTILWLGVIALLKKTSLDLLKVLAVMISFMNLIWFIGVLFLYLVTKSTETKAETKKEIKKEAPLDETFKRATSVSFDFFE